MPLLKSSTRRVALKTEVFLYRKSRGLTERKPLDILIQHHLKSRQIILDLRKSKTRRDVEINALLVVSVHYNLAALVYLPFMWVEDLLISPEV
tara:strand:+ start:723 stop:1001 length:279 start_codon:yes stop_codon:yes gene_type:complete